MKKSIAQLFVEQRKVPHGVSPMVLQWVTETLQGVFSDMDTTKGRWYVEHAPRELLNSAIQQVAAKYAPIVAKLMGPYHQQHPNQPFTTLMENLADNDLADKVYDTINKGHAEVFKLVEQGWSKPPYKGQEYHDS